MKRVLEFIRRFLGRIVLTLNLLAIVWLGLCMAASYSDPLTTLYVPLFSLSCPFAIFANVIFILAWLILSTRKIRALLSTVALLICYKLVLVVFGINYFASHDFERRHNTVKVMNWNVHGLGIFDVASEKAFQSKIVEYLKAENADVVCLPEFSVPKTQIKTDVVKKILANGNYVDYHFQADNTLGKNTFLGTIVFSRYPLHNFKATPLADYIYMLQGDVVLPGADTVRMFFAHLNTFGLSDNDKDYIEEIGKKDTDIQADINRSRSFLWKFNYAFVRRAREVKNAKKIINESPYPVVICGDFNDLPGSYTYTQVQEGLEDAFLKKGRGLGRTYNRLSPTLRIDYIFFDAAILKCIGYKSPFTSLSDHNPVIANFEIKPKP